MAESEHFSSPSNLHLLRVQVDPSWQEGDIVQCIVPLPNGEVFDSPTRRLFVEVPQAVGKWFYVSYTESSDGIPILSYVNDKCKCYPQEPDQTSPIVVPSSAIRLPRKSRGFLHPMLLFEIVLPFVVYCMILKIGSMEDWPAWHILALHIATMVIGCLIVYLRYYKSVLFVSIVVHGVLGFVLIKGVTVYLNTYTWRPIKWLFLQCDMDKETAETIANNIISPVVLAPLIEEVQKYFVMRIAAFKSTTLDANALIAYGLCGGIVFGAIENQYYVSASSETSWMRYSGLAAHMAYVTIASCRMAEWRFLGKHRGMFAVIWPNVLLHACFNMFCAGGGLWQSLTFAMDYDEVYEKYYKWFIVAEYLMDLNCWVITRLLIRRMDIIPSVNIRELYKSGQLSRHRVNASGFDSFIEYLADLFCCFSRTRRGFFRGNRHAHRPVLYESVTHGEKIQSVFAARAERREEVNNIDEVLPLFHDIPVTPTNKTPLNKRTRTVSTAWTPDNVSDDDQTSTMEYEGKIIPSDRESIV